MIRQNFNRNWQFQLNEGTKEPVDLPHDFSIIQKRSPDSPAGWGNGYFPGGAGDYEKILPVPEDWKGKSVILEFEGVYMNATVRVNDDVVVKQPYGYTTFHADLTPYLKYGQDNIVRVHVNNTAQPNCRWYTGSGIYRPVWLMVGETVFIKPFGLFVSTPEITDKKASVQFEVSLSQGKKPQPVEPKKVTVKTIVFDENNRSVAENIAETLVDSAADGFCKTLLEIPEPELWSDVRPYLYKAVAEVYIGNQLVDRAETNFGIRKIEFLPEKGFLLNGVKTYLRGGDVHHDCGIVGARSFDDAEERKVRALKENGFNAVRCSHNPPSPSFLNACDRYGILVIDEGFDGWRDGKRENDYHLYFEDWWQRDLSAMILRDRNHPSVILWSTGNEVNERDGRSDGCRWAKLLADCVRSLDKTRPVTHGINEKAKVPQEFIDCHDVTSFNYESKNYDEEYRNHPDRVILASENYLLDSFNYWMEPEKYPNVIGDFYWTAIDYFGESGLGKPRYVKEDDPPVYPWHQSFNSDIDICGYKRPQSFYRDCIWGLRKKPYIAVYRPEYYGWETGIAGWTWHNVIHSWNWDGFEGKPIAIEVYSVADEVELILNGKSLGKQPAGKSNKYIAKFDTIYEPGVLKAVGWVNGKSVDEDIVETTGTPAKLSISADKPVVSIEETSINADGRTDRLIYVTADLLDEKGNRIPDASNLVYFTAYGEATLIAVGSSNPKSEEMYVGNTRCLYEGRVMAVLRLNGKKGKAGITAMTDGLPPASLEIVIE